MENDARNRIINVSVTYDSKEFGTYTVIYFFSHAFVASGFLLMLQWTNPQGHLRYKKEAMKEDKKRYSIKKVIKMISDQS